MAMVIILIATRVQLRHQCDVDDDYDDDDVIDVDTNDRSIVAVQMHLVRNEPLPLAQDYEVAYRAIGRPSRWSYRMSTTTASRKSTCDTAINRRRTHRHETRSRMHRVILTDECYTPTTHATRARDDINPMMGVPRIRVASHRSFRSRFAARSEPRMYRYRHRSTSNHNPMAR